MNSVRGSGPSIAYSVDEMASTEPAEATYLEEERTMLFATDTLAGLASSTMLSSLSSAMRGYRVLIVETVNETIADVSKLTLFVNEETCASYQPSPDEIEMLF